MAGGDAALQAQADRLGGHQFQEAALVVVGLIAVQVGRPVILRRQPQDGAHVALAILPRPLVVRDAPHHVGAHLQGADHELLTVRKRVDALLGKGDDLDRDGVPDVLPHLQQRPERREVRIADVDVRAHVRHAVGQHPLQRGGGPPLDVLGGERLDALAPDLDALKQRAGAVVPGLPDGQHRVEMDVRLHQRRGHQAPGGVELDGGPLAEVRREHVDAIAADADVVQALATLDRRAANDQIHALSHPPEVCPEVHLDPFAQDDRIGLRVGHIVAGHGEGHAQLPRPGDLRVDGLRILGEIHGCSGGELRRDGEDLIIEPLNPQQVVHDLQGPVARIGGAATTHRIARQRAAGRDIGHDRAETPQAIGALDGQLERAPVDGDLLRHRRHPVT